MIDPFRGAAALGGEYGQLCPIALEIDPHRRRRVLRIALVGEKTWEKWMATVCKPFTRAKVRYFDATEIEAAKTWLAEE